MSDPITTLPLGEEGLEPVVTSLAYPEEEGDTPITVPLGEDGAAPQPDADLSPFGRF